MTLIVHYYNNTPKLKDHWWVAGEIETVEELEAVRNAMAPDKEIYSYPEEREAYFYIHVDLAEDRRNLTGIDFVTVSVSLGTYVSWGGKGEPPALAGAPLVAPQQTTEG